MSDKSTFVEPSRLRHLRLPAIVVVVAVFCLAFYRTQQYPVTGGFRVDEIHKSGNAQPHFESHFASSKLHVQTHAASIVELKNGDIRAFWFSGSREGARDVEIHSAVFNSAARQWSQESVVAKRHSTGRAVMRYVSKLGNPVCGRAADGRLWLFYVTVSVGGWSGSSITAKVSEDEGKTWSKPRRLVTSPFFNISTMVKGTPFLFADGTMGVPVYHEMINKFAEILRLDEQGNVVDLQRISSAKEHALQPVMVIKSTLEALILTRNSGSMKPRHAWIAATKDGGKSWSKPQDSQLLNPNSALSALALPDGRILAVSNNQERQGISKGRDALALMISQQDGKKWKMLYRLEDRAAERDTDLKQNAYERIMDVAARHSDATLKNTAEAHQYAVSAGSAMCGTEGCGFEFSYPYLIETKSGEFHLVYTWNRSFIKHISFNRAWLNQQLQK